MVLKSLPVAGRKPARARLHNLFSRQRRKGDIPSDLPEAEDVACPPEPRDQEALERENAELRAENRELREAVAELQRLSDLDPLLLILNRRAFLRECQRAQQYTKRHGIKAAFCYFDLDGLSAINNTYGHPVGDLALKTIVESVLAEIRGSDVFGRLGGDEFGLLLVEADVMAADRKMSELKQLIQSNPITDPDSGAKVPLSITFGVEWLDPTAMPESILARADATFYRNKKLYNRLFRR
ncbi:GGDEF domain-containing protein [Limibacillus sp. MBR-115]|jgi:diguanylate cyclase (GGDEF)-like protein|uniref:GGDEF domain-containing protein n=1 Tax=Limibacillus sp. MBR-115 TaxID=3156465 RepID=UPI00339A6731